MYPAQSRLNTACSIALSASGPIEDFAFVRIAIQDLYGDFTVGDPEVRIKLEANKLTLFYPV